MENIHYNQLDEYLCKAGLSEKFAVINNGLVRVAIDLSMGFKNNVVINHLKPTHSFFLGLALGVVHRDSYFHEVTLDTDLPGITEYQIDCDDKVIFIDSNYFYRKMSLLELCETSGGINELHSGAAFQIGLYLGYKQEVSIIKKASALLEIELEGDAFYLEYR